MELPKAYDAKAAEKNHYHRWETNGYFTPEINQDPAAENYSIVIPPPNVTGSLHMGHALQHTLMDVLARWKRMQGYRTLWLPGTDHASISVQRKVVEQLRKEENKTPLDIGRDEFVKRAWGWKEQYGNIITEQMRREGASVDWSRHRFTMDESLSIAVRNVFCTLYEQGWIYRGLRIVNWCPKDRTVLSDLEVKEETKKDGKLYYLKYPVASASTDSNDRVSVIVATTRPETMLGDTAVAVHPADARFKHLIGKTIALPLTGREIPIIADEYVDADFGTGAVKITPAHDPNDYLVGERHNLPKLLVMNDNGTMNAVAGPDFEGLDRFVAREKVIARFEELGLLDKVDDYEITLPVCERCNTIVEPILSEQWFVKMDEMRDMALDLMTKEGVPNFFPQIPNKKVYTSWLENLKDWTISRQLWWGHPIPAWYDGDGKVFVARSVEEAAENAGTSELRQDNDVLDTWFSSGLWAFSTLGWTGDKPAGHSTSPVDVTLDKAQDASDLDRFLPTDVLVTGRDIIFLWVSRMIMLTRKFTGEKAFNDVVITGTVLGKDGKPMSKSRNNGVDPIEMFDKFGVDATRIYLASIATGADIRWNDVGVETYRNFANKIWNATRFCLMNSEGSEIGRDSGGTTGNLPESILAQDTTSGTLADRWIVSRLNKTAMAVNRALGTYQFHEAVSLIYHFFWDDFCDWYIELKKDEINDGNSEAVSRMLTIIEQSLRILHPFMPYLTEDLWQKLPGTGAALHNPAYASAAPSIMLSDFPLGDAALIDERAETEMGSIISLIKRVRNIRAEMSIPTNVSFKVHVAAAVEFQEIFRANETQILKLARAESLIIGEVLDVPRASAKAVTNDAAIGIPLEGLIDFDVERDRLTSQVGKLNDEKTRLDGQLLNQSFVAKAPVDKVDALRARLIDLGEQIATLNRNIRSLG
ncbi:MAG: valine--tRNA ligase [Pyrinomonadaceae bacterium]